MANSPAESPMKVSNLSEFVHKMAQAYKRKSSTVAKQLEQQHKRASDDSNTTDGEASSRGCGSGRGAGAISQERISDLDLDGGYGFINSNKTSMALAPSTSSFFDSPSPPAMLPDPSLLAVKVRVLETLVSKLFSTISSLRSSYMQLQAAHSPYDPAKLAMADKAVVEDIVKLSDLKQSYAERDAILSGQSVDTTEAYTEHIPTSLQQQPAKDALLKSYAGIINNFHVEIRKKNAEVEGLKDMLAESTLQREKLERKVKKLEERLSKDALSPANGGASTSSIVGYGPNVQLLEHAVQHASEVSKSFTKLLISLMKAAQWDLDAASDSIEVGINYARRSHRKYAFESYVCQQMWNGFENEDFYIFGSLSSILDPDKHRRERLNEYMGMHAIDPLEFISVSPDCLFGKFCHKKFLQLVHPKMETSFFGNFEHRNQITEGSHPNSQFYQSFLRLAKAVWLVHRLAFSFDPTANIFHVRRGTDFLPACMESAVPGMEPEDNKVGFSVMPGFRADGTMIKCVVYLQASEMSIER